jgi:hypothetical protein
VRRAEAQGHHARELHRPLRAIRTSLVARSARRLVVPYRSIPVVSDDAGPGSAQLFRRRCVRDLHRRGKDKTILTQNKLNLLS